MTGIQYLAHYQNILIKLQKFKKFKPINKKLSKLNQAK